MWLQPIFMACLLAKTPKGLLLVRDGFANFERTYTRPSWKRRIFLGWSFKIAGSPGMTVWGAFFDLLIGFIQGWLTPHLGFDGGLVIVIAVVMHLAEAFQRLRRRRPVVQGWPGRESFVWGLEGGYCAGDLRILCEEKKGERRWLCDSSNGSTTPGDTLTPPEPVSLPRFPWLCSGATRRPDFQKRAGWCSHFGREWPATVCDVLNQLKP